MREKDLTTKLVENLERIPGVKRVEIVPVCEIYIDTQDNSKETRMKVANAITEVATEEQEEIYWDVEVEP
ncbi:MAG: hypothetical protein DSY34_04895 [Desulfurobacterium sp.]|nr:MAG: hypothetical protein DSY34_04895 [Desulfurobacterium sp.]